MPKHHHTDRNPSQNPSSNEVDPPTRAEVARQNHQRKINDFAADRQDGLPVWIRSPKSGLEHYTGLSRSKLYELSDRRAIRSISLREPGAIKGTRLFHLQSILDYFESCESGGNGAK